MGEAPPRSTARGAPAGVTITRSAFGSDEWALAVEFRRALLRTPLGLDFSRADLAAEAEDTLFAAWSEERLVGVVMLRPQGGPDAKLRQMAVAEDMRGRHIGEQLVGALEDFAREAGARQIEMAARTTAVGFYERLGYVVDGGEFTEVTISHRHMLKRL